MVGRTDGRSFSSSLSLGPAQVPADLKGLVAEGQLAYERERINGTPYLVVGGRVPSSNTVLYYFFSEQRLWDELGQLRNILLYVLGGVVLLGGLVGALLARRMLRPVARASVA